MTIEENNALGERRRYLEKRRNVLLQELERIITEEKEIEAQLREPDEPVSFLEEPCVESRRRDTKTSPKINYAQIELEKHILSHQNA